MRRPNQIERYEFDDLDAFSVNAFVRPAPLATAQVTAHVVSRPAPPPPGANVHTMGVAVDDDRVYATRYSQHPPATAASEPDGTLMIVDRHTLTPIHPGITVGNRPRHVAVNPATGRLYVVNWGQRSYSLSVVDGATFAAIATVKLGQAPLQVAVNPTTNRIYVTSWFQGVVHVIDGATNQQLAPIDLAGKGPVGIDVDPTTNQIYVTVVNLSVAPFRNGIVRITDHGGSSGYTIEPFVSLHPLGAQSQDIAIDAEHDRVYVANLGGGTEHPSAAVLHRSDLGLLAKINIPDPGAASPSTATHGRSTSPPTAARPSSTARRTRSPGSSTSGRPGASPPPRAPPARSSSVSSTAT